MAGQERSLPFIKNLASSDRKLRDQALASLRTFLSARRAASSLSLLDALKLWKGLFFALWMADRPAPQQALCGDFAALLDLFGGGDAATRVWLAAFWATMAREWTGIDVLRMEKFLSLVRRVLEAELRYMRKEGGGGKKKWDEKRVEQVLANLRGWPLSTRENVNAEGPDEVEGDDDDLMPKTVPAGLKLHVLDIWIDEADKVGLLDEEDAQAREILERIDGLVKALHKGTTTTSVKVRSKEAMEDERLPWNVGRGEEEDKSEEETGWAGFD